MKDQGLALLVEALDGWEHCAATRFGVDPGEARRVRERVAAIREIFAIQPHERHERKEYPVTPIDHHQLRDMDRDDFRFYREHGPFETMEELRAARVGSR